MRAVDARGLLLRNLCVATALTGTITLSMSALATEVKVTLSGDQEAPPVATAASGSGELVFGTDKSVAGTIATKGLSATAVRIEESSPGKRGVVVVSLVKGRDERWVVPARTKLTDAQEASLLAGDLYVNVQTDAHKNGEIRGRVIPSASTSLASGETRR